MYQKMAKTLAHIPQTDILIMGFPAGEECTHPAIAFHPSTRFRRLSLRRFLQPFHLLFKMIGARPHHIIVNTHELLLPAVLASALVRARITYDIRENYYRNVVKLNSYHRIIRYPLAFLIRTIEFICSPFIYLFVLSDNCYAHELPFLQGRMVVVENKASTEESLPHQTPRQGSIRRLLFTGTLAASTGVFEAIDLVRQLHQVDEQFTLTIAGYCAQEKVLLELNRTIAVLPYVRLIGGASLVPHATVMEHIHTSDAGLILYQPNPATEGKRPTKMYEYLADRLPIITTFNAVVMAFCSPYRAAFALDPNITPTELVRQLDDFSFYSSVPGDEVLWESDAKKNLIPYYLA